MKMLMITWTDVFNGIGDFFQFLFKGMRALGHIPNVIIWGFILFGLVYWTLRLNRYRKEAQRNNTIE